MLHGAVHLALNHGVERALGGVDGDNDDVLTGLEAGSLNGLNGAQSHIVVAGKQDVDLVAVGLQEGLHDLLALGAGVLAGLGSHHVVLSGVGGSGNGIGEAGETVGSHGGAYRAFQNGNLELVAAAPGRLALIVDIAVNPLKGAGALLQGIGADVGHIQGGVGGNAAVYQHHGDAGVLGFLKHGVPAGLHDGAESDDIHVGGNEGADGLNLVLLLLLGVGELQGNAGVLGGLLDVVGVGGAPLAFGANLSEAHDNVGGLLLFAFPIGGGGAAVVSGAAAAAGSQRQGHHKGKQSGENAILLHHLYPLFF